MIKRVLFSISMVCVIGSSFTDSAKAEDLKANPRRNVIMMIMDGSSSSAVTLARWYKGEPLALDAILSGGVRTYSAIAAATDSAAAATAISTGYKTEEHYVGILPSKVRITGRANPSPKERHRPVATVLEGARLQGLATGVVATAEIQHATPAGFTSHVKHRKQFNDIAEQQVFQDMQVVLGGGKEKLNKSLIKAIQKKGYEFVETRDSLMSSESSRIWGSFAEKALAYELDRPIVAPTEPSLAEMTVKAIHTLKKDPDGFFLFVEGSKIDWAAHEHDPVGMVSDILAFDQAVGEAVRFAKEDGNTLVIAVADHGNSGLSIGNNDTSKSYASVSDQKYTHSLHKANLTLEGATSLLKKNRSNMNEVAKKYGLAKLSKRQIRTLKNSKHLKKELTNLFAEKSHLGFTTNGHTGEDVFLYSYGPEKPTGLLNNTDLAGVMASYMGFSLDQVSEQLFSNVSTGLQDQGFETRVVRSSARQLVAVKNGVTIRLTANQNVVLLNGKKHTLPGIVIFNGDTVYAPRQVLQWAEQYH